MKKNTSNPKQKSRSKSKHISHTSTHIQLRKGLVVYGLLVFLFFVLVSLSTYAIVNTMVARERHDRLTRLNDIYTTLNFDESYRFAQSNVFGDKRPYDWDESRSQSSVMEFGRNATREATFADLHKRAEAAGFDHVNTAYEGSAAEQHHYKNNKGEYLRVSVVNKSERDAMTYGLELPGAEETNRDDLSPVYVTIKANLDDNNE